MNKVKKSIVVLFTTAILTVSSVLMMIPPMFPLPVVAIVAGIVFAFRRSSLSLVCFGYPLTFGMLSALIGCVEIDDYVRTTAFAISVVIGMVGVGLMTTGLWKALGAMTELIAEQAVDGNPH